MKHGLSIREHNKQAHIDIEDDINDRFNGLFTFTLRVNAGNIVDYNLTEYVNAKQKYLKLKRILFKEFSFARNSRGGSVPNPLWSNYIQRGASERSGEDRNTKHSEEPKEKV